MLILRTPRTRSPFLVFLFSVLTLGLYLLYWYHTMYDDLESITGRTPTGLPLLFDLLLLLFTGGIWGIYMDYKISDQLEQLQQEAGVVHSMETGVLAVILDLAAYLTVAITFFLSSAIHQEQFNRIIQSARLRER